jgi:hypothetical protein
LLHRGGAHLGDDVREVAQGSVTPVVEVRNERPCTALSGELGVWHTQTDEASEEGLVQLGVPLERLILHHWWQLVVVTNQHNLQAATVSQEAIDSQVFSISS